MTEKQHAFTLAHAILDKPGEDPDSDISVLARQFLRAREEIDAMREALEPFAAFAPTVEAFVKSRANAANDASPIMQPTKHFRLNDFVRACAVLTNFTVPEKAK